MKKSGRQSNNNRLKNESKKNNKKLSKQQHNRNNNNISNNGDSLVNSKKSPPTQPQALRMQIISDSDHYQSYFSSRNDVPANNEYYLEKPPKFLQKGIKDNFMYEGHFHEAMGKILLIAQCFAMMPVRGITMPHPKYLSFSWTHVRTIFCLVFIICSTVDSVITVYKVLNGPITFNNMEPMIFRIVSLIVCISALYLARKWPELMVQWYNLECQLPPYSSQKDKRSMADKIRIVFFVGMTLSLAEHLLSVTQAIYYAARCGTTSDPVKNFLLITNEHLFYIFPYSYLLGWFGRLLIIISTFIWNYMAVFVMLISIGLTCLFKQINDNLEKFKNKQMPAVFWAERRVQYRNVCILCEKVDNAISMITMMSFSNNLYFICVQLLKSRNNMPSTVATVYFYFSLIFLFLRSLALSLYSAAVYDESRKPLRVLRSVPKESWCLEVKRFALEISSDLVALSGMKFFHLTRKLVLSVAGTIVTYELVLIQFYEPTNLWNC
ncbi:gustatory receptor for sugar taste 64f-like isoform X1 [Musca autumnalis]|uniref:gustatory receptor for sugar taste 64f-like isoform X1 n=2 Tax=Musca autumnalis TaxID=221902 RepID=UPI003CFAB475